MAFSLARRLPKNLLRTQFIKKTPQIACISNQERTIIGKREIVGFGSNGQPFYMDRQDIPFPAIRWKEPSCEINALREKEKGDWNELTCEEKKALYRASFCQTYAEFEVSLLGEWKAVVAYTLLLMAPALWIFFFWQVTVYKWMGKPDSFSKENRECQLRRILDLKMNPIEGISSKWDYEKDDWK